MSLTNTNTMRYIPTEVKPSKQKDLMVISEMRSFKIIRYLAYRHRVGLWSTTAVVLISYIAYDKFLHIFF